MRRSIVCCGIVWLGFTATAKAAGDWFRAGRSDAWTAGSVNHPVSKQLRDLARRQAEIRCVAFTPDGEWVVLSANQGVRTSQDATSRP